MRKWYEIKIPTFIKYYWDTATLVHLHAVCGDFRTTVTEFSSYFRSHMAHKVENIYYLALHKKSLLTPG